MAAMSVSVDEAREQALALKFLQAEGAAFPNFRLDEELERWEKEWGIAGPPAVFVFDREGKRVGNFNNESGTDFSYADVEKLVRQLLAKGTPLKKPSADGGFALAALSRKRPRATHGQTERA
jgi:hypothetical protein